MLKSILLLATLLVSAVVGDQAYVERLASTAYKNTQNSVTHANGSCTAADLVVRQEWRKLSKKQKTSYINAVLCLQSKPSRFSREEVGGARSRFDDFVAVHINQTLTIHYTGTFLSWHRYYTWLYETALREECGYSGYQPYWEWSLDALNPLQSPLFDGSPYSLGGNGAYNASWPGFVMGGNGLPEIIVPPGGTGGGCVQQGPFANMTVNLGPISLYLTPPVTSTFEYNPRCLKRDVNAYISSRWNQWDNVTALLQKTNIYDFEMTMQGVPGSGEIGVHGGGHFTFGMDPGGDLFTSPGDPAFWFHHGQIDRMWWTWQQQDVANRLYALNGTGTFLNDPVSPDTTLDTVIDMSVLGEPKTVGELMSTTAGPFCYVYA